MRTAARAAVVMDATGAVEVRSYPVPDPGPGEFVVELELCGACGTDAHIYQGRLDRITLPALLGHEIVGTLAALGEGVTADHSGQPVTVGDRVGVFPALSCGRCYQCQVRRRPANCPDRRPSYGFTSPVTVPPHLTGGFADYLHAANAGTVFYRTALPPEVAVLQEPMSVALHGIARGSVGVGSTVVVQGVGAIGLMAVVAARAAGAHRVVAVGAPAARLELAAALGADATVSIQEVTGVTERRSAVFDALGAPGADCVIGASGSPAAFMEAIGLVTDGGVLAELGNFTDRGTVPFNPFSDLLKRDITIAGVYGAGPDMLRHYRQALLILERGDRPYDRVVSHRVPLERVGEALAALGDGSPLDGRDIVKLAIDPTL